jgi:hypothetical protein
METDMDKGKIFIIKVHGWEEMFVKKDALKNKDSFDKIIANILADHPNCNTVLLPPITKAERHKIHTYQRKNKMTNSTIYKNDNSEIRSMLITVTPKYIKELLLKYPKNIPTIIPIIETISDNVPNIPTIIPIETISDNIPNIPNNNSNNFNEQLESILNDFKNRIKELIKNQ